MQHNYTVSDKQKLLIWLQIPHMYIKDYYYLAL